MTKSSGDGKKITSETSINNKEACASMSRFRIPPFRFRVYHLTATKPPNSVYKYLY